MTCLPDMDGKEVVTKIRDWSDVPIIVLTARGQEQEKIDALDVVWVLTTTLRSLSELVN